MKLNNSIAAPGVSLESRYHQEIICSLNSTVCSSTGFSPQRLVFAQEVEAPLDKLIGKPHYEDNVKEEVKVQEPSPFGEFVAERAIELGKLGDKEGRNQLTEDLYRSHERQG